MPGPLPNPQRRRTNAPTIPTTTLPAEGRSDPPPKIPAYVKLGKTGRAWWRWAWSTPQAAAWALGHEGTVARRAALEDDLGALEQVEGLDFTDLIGDETLAGDVRAAVQRVAALATGRLQIMKEMRELDDRLGLTPKAMAALRWSIAAPSAEEKPGPGAEVVIPDRWLRSAAG